METKKKKKLFNLIMILLILFVIFCGVMAVGNIKGWFSKNQEHTDILSLKGICYVERNDVAYTLKPSDLLNMGDIITVTNGASVRLGSEDAEITVSDNSIIKITDISDGKLSLELLQGEAFIWAEAYLIDNISLSDSIIHMDDGVILLSAQKGSSTAYSLLGNHVITYGGESETIEEGTCMLLLQNEKSKGNIELISLNDFALSNIRRVNEDTSLFFSNEDISEMEKARQEEIERAKAEQLKNETVNTGGHASNPGNTGSSNATGNNDKIPEKEPTYCTIEIRCDTILNNMDNLETGKEVFVPDSGTILSTTRVEFLENETVFEVLKRVCDAYGIQLEYSYTALYESYYIEGINHLYEFDCGNESGWMYKVNGWFPNYGCSAYRLKDGDTIVWCYTCNGLGADVGGSVY
ncbi:MAG: DUF4430 domain-containing protein [Clostridia bacterium]|nr:DUF4430 domain-containing protein [Clostridia bacterium]